MDHCRPIRVTGTAQHAGKDFLAAESVNMPLSTDGRTVDRLFMVTVFSY
ncbi:hypothetical protein [Oceanibacterium hippocampi]|uniref:Uncharacterized protein n=1 Tax=Oceanibacterium hippocampi TaxID=745714 RepID=A0A1Y5SQG4_9PROT|nr:hypothetical protein [Oceanibacterium hippocampi]SLN45555.1 hypothetical protein OCH7691_01962 [Oceanibacterium hippocampi]